MNKAEALKCFYEKNKIIFSRCSDETDGNYDKRIASLPEQIDEWLSHIHRDDHSLFLSLLSRYTYLTQAQCKLRYGSVAALLQNELKAFDIPLSEVMFVTVESSASRATGADNVRADLKQQLFGEIYKEQIVPAERNLKTEDLEQYKAIVFLDDIIGSGMTLWKHLHSFCERFSINGCGKHKLFYACIVPRAHGIRHIRQNCKQNRITAYPLFDVCWTEDAAFSTDSPEYTQAAKYEKMIDDYLHNDQKSFFMGFNKNRMLVSFYYNTPNNTLSTFWANVPEANHPPFLRDGNQKSRPTVNALKTKKAELVERAYAYGEAHKRKDELEHTRA